MKIVVYGPALTRTGYGEHARFVLRALKTNPNIDLFFIPLNWGGSSWVWEDSEERKWLDSLVQKTDSHIRSGGSFDVSIQVTIPNEWKKMCPTNIGVTAGIETTKASPVWLEKANEMDKVITISEHSKMVLQNSFYDGFNKFTGEKMRLTCNVPVEVVHYPVKQFETKQELDFPTSFNYLTIAQWGPRKNVGATIEWFVEEFIDNPDVGLIVKTAVKGGSVMDRYVLEKEFTRILSKYENRKCKVYLLHGDMTDEEIHSLYVHPKVKCYISLTHGEGFGLPTFEAAYSGLPVLATDWSGHLDFLYMPVVDKNGKDKMRAHFARVDYDLMPIQREAVWDGVLQPDSMWAFPKQGSYKMKLREVYKDYGRFSSQAKTLKTWVLENFEESKQYEKFNSHMPFYNLVDLEDIAVF